MTNRLFIAAEIPENMLDMLIAERDKYSHSELLRWEDKNKLHITLKFLGDTDESKTDQIIESMKSVFANYKKIDLRFSNFGLFYRNNEPSILWAGFNYSEKMNQLYVKLENSLQEIGFERERRKFKPHLTLLRVKNRRFNKEILEYDKKYIETEVFQISQITLFKSELKRSGAEYTKIKSFELI